MLEINDSEILSFRVASDDEIECMTNLEILKKIYKMTETSNAEFDMDVTELIRYMAKLEERAPIAYDYTPGEIWNGLKQTYPELFQEA